MLKYIKMDIERYKKFMIENFTLKPKYLEELISELPPEGFDISKFEKLGNITIELFLYSYNFNNSSPIDYNDILYQSKLDDIIFKAYIGYSEYIIDKKTKIGVGYGVVYNILSNFKV